MRRFCLLVATVMVMAAPGTARPVDFFDQYCEIVKDPATKKIGGFVWDNDAFYFMGRATDQFYTNGFMMERKYEGQAYYFLDDQSGKFRRAGDDQLAAWQPGVEGERTALYRQSYGIHFGQNLYTPSDIELTAEQLDPRDRPYAAWFYLGVYREIISHSNAWMKYGFDLGILGPTAKGRQTQSAVHRFPYLHAAQPQGWDTQIRDEYGIQLFAENGPGSMRGNFRVRLLCMDEVFNVEAAPVLRLNVGNIFVNAEASLRFRFGQFDPVFKRPSVSGGINPGIVPGGGSSLHAAPRELSRERYLFWAITGRAVGYNGTIEGRRSAQTAVVHEEPLVYDTEAGFVYHARDRFISYSIVVRSAEFKEQSSKFPQHRFGRIAFGWEY